MNLCVRTSNKQTCAEARQVKFSKCFRKLHQIFLFLPAPSHPLTEDFFKVVLCSHNLYPKGTLHITWSLKNKTWLTGDWYTKADSPELSLAPSSSPPPPPHALEVMAHTRNQKQFHWKLCNEHSIVQIVYIAKPSHLFTKQSAFSTDINCWAACSNLDWSHTWHELAQPVMCCQFRIVKCPWLTLNSNLMYYAQARPWTGMPICFTSSHREKSNADTQFAMSDKFQASCLKTPRQQLQQGHCHKPN